MKTEEKAKYVYIKWVDSMEHHGWADKDYKADSKEQMTIESIGILHEETKESICITTSKSFYGSIVSPMSIPKCAIVESWEFDL